MPQFVIFDLNGIAAWFDRAASKEDALKALIQEDESYTTADIDRVHELNAEETSLLATWIDDGQKTHKWPLDWHPR